jgi:hypothetical protein
MMKSTSPLTDRLYVEGRPYNYTWTHEANCICADENWAASGSWPDILPDDQILGEICRWPQQPNWVDPSDCGWGGTDEQVSARIIADVNRINAEGHTAIVDIRPLIRSGKTIEDFAV